MLQLDELELWLWGDAPVLARTDSDLTDGSEKAISFLKTGKCVIQTQASGSGFAHYRAHCFSCVTDWDLITSQDWLISPVMKMKQNHPLNSQYYFLAIRLQFAKLMSFKRCSVRACAHVCMSLCTYVCVPMSMSVQVYTGTCGGPWSSQVPFLWCYLSSFPSSHLLTDKQNHLDFFQNRSIF